MGTLKPIDLEAIQERIAAQQGALPQTPAGSSPPSRRLIIKLWELMARMYGHRWSSAYGDEIDPGNVWAAVIDGLDEMQIRHGMRELVRQGYDWPPSAPEFRKLCTGASDVSWEHRRIEAADRERQQKALQDLRDADQKQAEADAAIAGIKSIMGMS